MSRDNTHTLLLAIICAILVLTGMKLAEDLFGPIVAAVVLGIVCAPFADKVEDMGLPRSVAALLVLAIFLIVTLALFFVVEPTISKAIRNGPLIGRELMQILEMIKSTLSGVQDLQESVSEALNEGSPAAAKDDENAVVFPGVMDALAYAPYVATGLMVFVGTLYFFLVARNDIYRKVDRLNVPLDYKILCEAETRVSRYFIAITSINAVFGVLVAIVFTALGVQGALIWGLAAFLINFVLYLGPALFAISLIIAGVVQYDGAASFLPAALYIGLNLVEGQFVTPSLVGRHMSVNPLLIFISLVFWLWLWGPVGGVVAIPMLVWSLFIFEKFSEPATGSVRVDEDGKVSIGT